VRELAKLDSTVAVHAERCASLKITSRASGRFVRGARWGIKVTMHIGVRILSK